MMCSTVCIGIDLSAWRRVPAHAHKQEVVVHVKLTDALQPFSTLITAVRL